MSLSQTLSNRRAVVPLAALSLALVASACSSSSGPSASAGGNLVIADVQPFSGPDAAFGPEQNSGCLTAVKLINAGGGVLGHKLACQIVDTRGDPVDAVPAVQKLIALTTNLVGAVGPSSDEASATTPLLEAAHIPMFSNTGQSEYDHQVSPYFYRILAADDAGGYAFAAYAAKAGYTRVAAIFGDTISSQANVPTVIAGLKHLGIKLVLDQKLTQDQSSYLSEAAQLKAAKPQAVITETDPQTFATYLADLKQLSGGSILPFIGPIPTPQPVWYSAITKAIGKSAYAQYYRSVHQQTSSGGPAFSVWQHTLLGLTIPNPKQWLNDPYAQAPYDGANLIALAILAAHSTQPTVFNKYITRIANAGAGKVTVHSFAAGKAALAAGHQIHYAGLSDIFFNKYNNSTSGFVATKLGPGNSEQQVALLTATDLAKASGG